MCTIIHSATLDQLSDLAIIIGDVLGLREPENEVINIGTIVQISKSTDFKILLEDLASATEAVVTMQTLLFLDAVTEDFYNNFNYTIEEFYVESVFGPFSTTSDSTSNNTTIIFIAGVAGGAAALLCFFCIYQYRRIVRRRNIQKQVTEMFSASPGSYRWEIDLPAIIPPTEMEIEDLFEEDYMEMEGQIEGFTPIGSRHDGGRGATEGGTRPIREGDDTLRILSLDELVERTPDGGSSETDSASDSSNEYPEEPYSPSLPPKKPPPDFSNLVDIPVDELIQRVKERPDLMDGVNDRPKRSTERNRKW